MTRSADEELIRQSLLSVSPGLTIVDDYIAEDSPSKVNRERFSFIVARRVASFTVSRPSSYTVHVCLGIGTPAVDIDGAPYFDGKLATLTFVVPCGR